MADRYQDRPFPADGNYDRGGRQAPSKSENDPLAELARLIGQTDPFAGLGRANQPVQPRGNPRDPLPPQPAPEAEPGPAGQQPSWMQRAAQQPPQQQDFDAGRLPPAPRFAAPPVAEPNYSAPPPFAAAPQLPQQGFDTGRPAPGQRYAAEPDYQAQPQPFAVPRDDDEQQQNGQGRYDDALYGQMPRASGGLPQDSGYDDPYAYQDDYNEGTGDQALRPRRGGISTVAAVIALAVVGTGAAFAYRAYVGSPRSGEPPIIRADAGPNKMLPPTQSGDTTGKLIQDRMTGSATERMVSREEQPMDLKDGQPGPRVIFPPLNQNANPPPAASVAPTNRPMSNAGMGAAGMGSAAMGNTSVANAGNGNLAGDEPRKIRTLSVRGDQADAAAAPAAKPAAMRTAAPAAAMRNPPAATNANASAAAPMSISPQAAAPAPGAPRMAAINTPQPVTSAAATSSGGGGGNYMVQVASQRNEADAQASFKSLQGKYPAVLGSREPLIKRADLGEKGIYYRAMVGPFGSPNEATQFCAGLKTAGGQCVVQRN